MASSTTFFSLLLHVFGQWIVFGDQTYMNIKRCIFPDEIATTALLTSTSVVVKQFDCINLMLSTHHIPYSEAFQMIKADNPTQGCTKVVERACYNTTATNNNGTNCSNVYYILFLIGMLSILSTYTNTAIITSNHIYLLLSILCLIKAANTLPFEFEVTLYLSGRECSGQLKNLGPFLAGVEHCAAAAYTDPSCITDQLMWSDSYSHTSPSWGCRCCTSDPPGVVNIRWDIYQFVRYPQQRPPIGYFKIILSHKNVLNGYFSSSLKTSGLENQYHTTANTYSIIGKFHQFIRDEYANKYDNKYLFKLVYHYDSYPDDILIWTQTSWITDENIVGAELFGVPNQSRIFDSNAEFYGLGLNVYESDDSYLDGEGGLNHWWYNAVGVMSSGYHGYIPGFAPQNSQDKKAYGQSLYIYYSTNASYSSIPPCYATSLIGYGGKAFNLWNTSDYNEAENILMMANGKNYSNTILFYPDENYTYIEWKLNGNYDRLTAVIGQDKDENDCIKCQIRYMFYIDEINIYQSAKLGIGEYENVDIDVKRGNILQIKGDNVHGDPYIGAVIAEPLLYACTLGYTQTFYPTLNPTSDPTVFATSTTWKQTNMATATIASTKSVLINIMNSKDNNDNELDYFYTVTATEIIFGVLIIFCCCILPLFIGFVVCFCMYKKMQNISNKTKPALANMDSRKNCVKTDPNTPIRQLTNLKSDEYPPLPTQKTADTEININDEYKYYEGCDDMVIKTDVNHNKPKLNANDTEKMYEKQKQFDADTTSKGCTNDEKRKLQNVLSNDSMYTNGSITDGKTRSSQTKDGEM